MAIFNFQIMMMKPHIKAFKGKRSTNMSLNKGIDLILSRGCIYSSKLNLVVLLWGICVQFSLLKLAAGNVHHKSVPNIIFLQPFQGRVDVIHLHNFNRGCQIPFLAKFKHFFRLFHATNKASRDGFPSWIKQLLS